jgi:hypothetical protein
MRFRRDHMLQWTLLADNGQATPIYVLDLRGEGYGFVVNWDDENWGSAATLAEAQRMAMEVVTGPAAQTATLPPPRRRRQRRRGSAAVPCR